MEKSRTVTDFVSVICSGEVISPSLKSSATSTMSMSFNGEVVESDSLSQNT